VDRKEILEGNRREALDKRIGEKGVFRASGGIRWKGWHRRPSQCSRRLACLQETQGDTAGPNEHW
jgi:hypothetical protein